MIFRVLIATAAVLACFFMPSFVASEYTEMLDLLQDGILSGTLIVIVLRYVKGTTAILIAIIEACLIVLAGCYAINFNNRHSMYVAINYTTLHDAAFWLELAIIGARLITGYKEIGADCRSSASRHSAASFFASHRERRK